MKRTVIVLEVKMPLLSNKQNHERIGNTQIKKKKSTTCEFSSKGQQKQMN